jgi:hypothetical protein
MVLTACYRDSFTFLYVDDVRTSQETHLWASRPDTGVALSFYMYMLFVPHRKHSFEPPRPVTGIALLFICRWCSYLTGNTYVPARSASGAVGDTYPT